MPKKRCWTCKRRLPILQFHVRRKSPDGRTGECADCVSKRIKDWRRRNPERKKANDRAYHLRTAQKHRQRSREWTKNNPERARATQLRLYTEKRLERIQASASWRKANPDRTKAHRVKYKARRRGATVGSFTGREWSALVKRWGSRCLRCRKRKRLTADHVIPIARGGTNYIENIQPLCMSCNCSKGAKIVDYRGVERD